MGNSEDQDEEVEVLQSIYDETILTINKNEPSTNGTILIHNILPDPFFIKLRSKDRDNQTEQAKVQYLPPMMLHFQYVESYPTITGPAFLLMCQWLNEKQLSDLCKELDKIYKDCKPEVVLFRWINFLVEESLKFLEIGNELDLTSLKDYKSLPIEVDFSLPIAKKEKQATPPKPKVHRDTQEEYVPPKSRSNVKTHSYAKRRTGANNRNSEPKKESNESKEMPLSETNERATSSAQMNQTLREQEESEKNKTNARIYMRLKSGVITHRPSIKNVLEDPDRDSRGLVQLLEGSELLSKLIEYNEKRKHEMFQKEWFTCKVCMVYKQGYQALRFQGCDHLYCKECMKEYFEVQIREGNVRGLTCPEEKCSTQALPHQVFESVGEELYDQYDRILLDSSLSQMTDLTRCPRNTCQCFIIIEPGVQIATCTACKYPFCIYCKKTYHGLEPCRFKEEERKGIRDQYLKGSDEVKRNMEKKYGKKQLLKLINESLSDEWVKSNSKKCPHCCAAIEKSDGCNKMICWRCNTTFCWLCNMRLNPEKPYLHYNDDKSPCFTRLFFGAVGMDNDLDSDSDDEFEFVLFD